MVAAAGGAPAVTTRKPGGAFSLTFLRSICDPDQDRGCGAKTRNLLFLDLFENQYGIYSSQANMSTTNGSNGPDERPAICMKHRKSIQRYRSFPANG